MIARKTVRKTKREVPTERRGGIFTRLNKRHGGQTEGNSDLASCTVRLDEGYSLIVRSVAVTDQKQDFEAEVHVKVSSGSDEAKRAMALSRVFMESDLVVSEISQDVFCVFRMTIGELTTDSFVDDLVTEARSIVDLLKGKTTLKEITKLALEVIDIYHSVSDLIRRTIDEHVVTDAQAVCRKDAVLKKFATLVGERDDGFFNDVDGARQTVATLRDMTTRLGSGT